MSKEVNKWVRMCLRKSKLTERIANEIINKADIKLYKYHCPYCQHWHITKQPNDN